MHVSNLVVVLQVAIPVTKRNQFRLLPPLLEVWPAGGRSLRVHRLFMLMHLCTELHLKFYSGTAIEHLVATFNSGSGLLEDAAVDTIVLDCTHGTDEAASELLDRYDAEVQLLYATTAGVLLGDQPAEGDRGPKPTNEHLEQCVIDVEAEQLASLAAAPDRDAAVVSDGITYTVAAALQWPTQELVDRCGCTSPERVWLSNITTSYSLYPRCGCRVTQCAVGSLVADAVQFITKADVTMINAGAIRHSLPAGDITHGAVLKLLPFLTEVAKIEQITGAALRTMLSSSLDRHIDPSLASGGFLQFGSSMKVEWFFLDGMPILHSVLILDAEASAAAAAAATPSVSAGQRKADNNGAGSDTVDDAVYVELDDLKYYSLGTTAYLASGGDGYNFLSVYDLTRFGVSEYEAVIQYVAPANYPGENIELKPLQSLRLTQLPSQTRAGLAALATPKWQVWQVAVFVLCVTVVSLIIVFASYQRSRQHQIAIERRVANVYMLAGQPVPLKSGRKKSKAMMPGDIVSDSEAAAVSASDSVITDAGIAFPIPQKDPKELTAAVFEAIHFDLFETIPFLLARGASASTRDAEMQLPLTRLLAAAAERADVESGLVQPSKQYLQRTFHSSRVRGTTEATRTQQIRIATYHLVAQHCEFDRMLSMIMQRPAPKLMMEDAVQRMAKEAWTSDDGLEDTVAHRLLNACRERSLSEDLTMELVEAVLEINPAILTVANVKGVTPSDIAVRCDEMPHIQQRFTVVLFEHFQLLRPNQPMYKSATAEIHECSDLRLVHEASPNTASAAGSGLGGEVVGGSTAAAAEVWRHLSHRSHGGAVAGGGVTAHPERFVMKLMADPDLWRRELYIRDHLKDQGDGNCIKIASAALVDARNGSARISVHTIDSIGNGSPHPEYGRRGSDVSVASRKRQLSQLVAQVVSNNSNPALQYATEHGTPERPITIVPQALVNTNRRAEARNLMKQFPYAIIMPLADRNLGEIISSERLAEEPLDTIRHTALKILTAVSSLHQKGVVHGDLKPTNIVRVNRDLCLLDLDMAFIKDSEDDAGHANLEKLCDSTAYAAPELHRWIPALDERNGVDAVSSGSNMSSARTSPSLTNAGGGDSSAGGGLSRNDVLNDCTNEMPALSPTLPIDCFKAPEQMDLWSFAVSEITPNPVTLASTLDVGSMCTCHCA